MDFNDRIDDLQKRVTAVKSSVDAAAHETHQQLSQRIDTAHTDADRALSQAKQEAGAAAERTQDSWEQTRADAQARMAVLKAKAQRRADQVDADFAASDADLAEADASDAIDFADWAVENARLAILDAIDARITADEKTATLV
jgi:hypothetical protein